MCVHLLFQKLRDTWDVPESFLNGGGKGIWTEAGSSLQEEEDMVSSNIPEKYTLVHLTCSCANGENRMRLTGRCHI